MLNLLSNYSIGEILVFIVVLAIAVKEICGFFDWCNDKLKNRDKKNQVQIDFQAELKTNEQEIAKLAETFNSLQNNLKSLSEQVKLLIDSDKDDIKSYIVERHHYFCYDQKYIDDYSLDCLERRFKHYANEGGNSYIEDLMKDLRTLDKRPPQ